MAIFQIHASSTDQFTELLSDEIETAELFVEDVVSRVFLRLFGESTIDDVTIRFRENKRDHCDIHIQVRSPQQSFTLFPLTEEHIQTAVASSIHNVLKELLTSVKVTEVKLNISSWD